MGIREQIMKSSAFGHFHLVAPILGWQHPWLDLKFAFSILHLCFHLYTSHDSKKGPTHLPAAGHDLKAQDETTLLMLNKAGREHLNERVPANPLYVTVMNSLLRISTRHLLCNFLTWKCNCINHTVTFFCFIYLRTHI